MLLGQEKKKFTSWIILSFFSFAGLCFGQSSWEVSKLLAQGNSPFNQLLSVTYGNGHFVVVGNYDAIFSSPEGKMWTTINLLPSNQSLRSVIYGNGQFVAVGGNGMIFTSPDDATTWTNRNSGTSADLQSVIYGGSQFLIVSNLNTFETSTDGIIWTIKNVAYNQEFQFITYVNNQFMAVDFASAILSAGDDCGPSYNPCPPDTNKILTSVDGSTWKAQIIGSYPLFFYSLAYGNGLAAEQISEYVEVGFYGAILKSPDGAAWTTNKSGTTNNLRSVIYDNRQFVAVGDSGTILTSPDGTTWTKQSSGTTNNLNSVTYANGLFMAVGDSGTILTAKADPVGVAFQTKAKPNISSLKILNTKNHISAMLPNEISFSQLKVGLFNVSGKRIYSAVSEARNGILNIPAKGFPTGKYFMSITDENNKTLNSSFVLAK